MTDPRRIKALTTSQSEPQPWTAAIDYAAIKAAPFPKLVLSGDWHEPLEATAIACAEAMGGIHEVFEGSGHGAQRTGKRFNDRWLQLIGQA